MNNIIICAIVCLVVSFVASSFITYNFAMKQSYTMYIFIIIISLFVGFFTQIYLPLDIALVNDETILSSRT